MRPVERERKPRRNDERDGGDDHRRRISVCAIVDYANRGWPDRRTDIEKAIDPTIGGPERGWALRNLLKVCDEVRATVTREIGGIVKCIACLQPSRKSFAGYLRKGTSGRLQQDAGFQEWRRPLDHAA
jgi:hypothetical protein